MNERDHRNDRPDVRRAPAVAHNPTGGSAISDDTQTGRERVVVPVIEEVLELEKRRTEVGGVRIHKRVVERTETIDEPLMSEELDVERVELNEIVHSAPPIRYEGDTMIVPLVEEIFVTEKRLLLREEVHIRRRQVDVRRPQNVVLRREEVDIESIKPEKE